MPVARNPLRAPTHTPVDVATTSGEIVGDNPAATYRLIINDSDVKIYIALGETAVVGECIPINANGSSYEMTVRIGNLWTGPIEGIHGDTGTKRLIVVEAT